MSPTLTAITVILSICGYILIGTVVSAVVSVHDFDLIDGEVRFFSGIFWPLVVVAAIFFLPCRAIWRAVRKLLDPRTAQ